jgi:hypothetical protein
MGPIYYFRVHKMNSDSWAVWLVFALLIAVIIGIFIWVAVDSSRGSRPQSVRHNPAEPTYI